MYDDSHPLTNNISHWKELGLDKTNDALWYLDYQSLDFNPIDKFDRARKIFLISAESNTKKFHCINRSDVYYFDSAIYFSLSGQGRRAQIPPMTCFPWMYHFEQVRKSDQKLDFLKYSIDVEKKNTNGLLFDVLLGLKRLHRDFAFEYINKQPMLKSRCFMTYYYNRGNSKNYHVGYNGISSNGLWYTADPVRINNTEMSWSHILPMDIYNMTFYSLVAETKSTDRYFSLYTEKTAKPILAKRPFIVLSSKNFLLGLRTLGYQTFDPIIDESYDQIVDDKERWQAAMQSMEKLSKEDPLVVYQKLAPILEHNHDLFKNTNWDIRLNRAISQISGS